MLQNLNQKKCLPCELGSPKLTPKEIQNLSVSVPKWNISKDTEISRDFKFQNFAEALIFVTKVGSLAEHEGHHPDIEFGWGYAKIKLTTHAVKGLSENDFIMAAKIDSLGKNQKPRLGPIIIGVNNIEKVRNFYLSVFEIEVEKESNHYLSSRLNDTHIELEEDSENRFPNWKSHNVSTYKNSEFIVYDLETFLKKVSEYGGKVINGPMERPWGGINAEIADPDGNIFLISQEK